VKIIPGRRCFLTEPEDWLVVLERSLMSKTKIATELEDFPHQVCLPVGILDRIEKESNFVVEMWLASVTPLTHIMLNLVREGRVYQRCFLEDPP